jgi:hypothetical protein
VDYLKNQYNQMHQSKKNLGLSKKKKNLFCFNKKNAKVKLTFCSCFCILFFNQKKYNWSITKFLSSLQHYNID